MSRLIAILVVIIVLIIYINRGYICKRLVLPDVVEWENPRQKTPPLYDGGTLRQYFIPRFNGLFRIGFRAEYKNADDVEMAVSLREVETDRELFREVIPLRKFPKDRIRRFSFPPLWDSAGKNYYLNISVHNAGSNTDLRLLYDTWPFFHTRVRGILYFDGREFPGELSMVSECRVRVSRDGFISFWKDFMSDRIFALIYFSLIGIIITLYFAIRLLPAQQKG